jgi:hypothetical protein
MSTLSCVTQTVAPRALKAKVLIKRGQTNSYLLHQNNGHLKESILIQKAIKKRVAKGEEMDKQTKECSEKFNRFSLHS